MIVFTLIVMAIYSWQLALVVVVAYLPVIPIFRFLQRRQLAASDRVTHSNVRTARRGLRDGHRRLGHPRLRIAEPFAPSPPRPYRPRVPGPDGRGLVLHRDVPLGDYFGTIAIAGITVVGASTRSGGACTSATSSPSCSSSRWCSTRSPSSVRSSTRPDRDRGLAQGARCARGAHRCRRARSRAHGRPAHGRASRSIPITSTSRIVAAVGCCAT